MRSKIFSTVAILGVCATAGILISGCSKDAAVTQTEEQRFKNPSKEMPPEALKVMKEHSAQPPQAAGAPK